MPADGALNSRSGGGSRREGRLEIHEDVHQFIDRDPHHRLLREAIAPEGEDVLHPAQALAQFGAEPPRKGRGLVGKERALIKALGAIPLERRIGTRPRPD